MNTQNKLVIDKHGRNHFKFYPCKERELPSDEKEQIEMVEELYDSLVDEGYIIFTKSKKGNYLINCVKLGDKCYIVVCLKNEFNTFNNSIYEVNNENDAIAITKFIGKNIGQTMRDYKKQILDAREMVVRKNEEKPSTND